MECRGEVEICCADDDPLLNRDLSTDEMEVVQIGTRAFIYLLDLRRRELFPLDEMLYYDLKLETTKGLSGLAQLQPSLLYSGQNKPSLIIKQKIDLLLQGSCRNPDHPSDDSLLAGDQLLAIELNRSAVLELLANSLNPLSFHILFYS
jgi:hypothetical protein